MLFATAKSHLFFSLFSLISYLEKSLGYLEKREEWKEKSEEYQKEKAACATFLFGATTQIRTGDLVLTKDALYQLSHSSKYLICSTCALYQKKTDLSIDFIEKIYFFR